jgi:hypothetical protein
MGFKPHREDAWSQSFMSAVWNPQSQEWDLTPEEKAQIKINLVRRQGPPTDNAYDETWEEDFRQRTPILYKHDTVWAGHPGDTHQDIADEFGLGDVDDLDTYHHGSWLPQGGFNKKPGSLNWLYNSGSLKKEWNEAILEALNAKEEPQDWGQAFSKTADSGPAFKWYDQGPLDPGKGKDYQGDHSFLYEPDKDLVHIGTENMQHMDISVAAGRPRAVAGWVYDNQFGGHFDQAQHDRLFQIFKRMHMNTTGEHLDYTTPEAFENYFGKVAFGPQHSLVWEPGWPGKGFYHNGELTTWGVSSTNPLTAWPHHAHMWGQKYPGTKLDDAEPFAFAIDPEGRVKRAGPYGVEAPEIYQIEPRLRPVQEESWGSQF